jgi:hypothetical protein
LPYQQPELWTGLEPGWRALCRIGGTLGLSYNGFACILAIVSTYLLYLFAKGAGINTSFFLSLFLIYPGLISLVQFRQFFASAIVAAGVLFLCREGRLKYIWFLLAVALAFTIHRSALVMAMLVFFPLIDREKGKSRMLLIMPVLAIAVFVLFNAEEFATFAFGESKTSAYLQKTDSVAAAASYLGGIRNIVYLVGMGALALLCAYVLRGDETGSALLRERHDLWLAVIGGNIAMLALLPFATIGNDFMRFQRYAFTLSNALFALMPMMKRKNSVLSCKALYVAVCLAFAYPFVIAGTSDSVYVSLLSIEAFPPFFS